MEKTKFTVEQENYVKEQFGILKISQIAENLNLKERSVRYLCKKFNLKLSSEQKTVIFKQKNKKYSHNVNFFSEINNKWIKTEKEIPLTSFLETILNTQSLSYELLKSDEKQTFIHTEPAKD